MRNKIFKTIALALILVFILGLTAGCFSQVEFAYINGVLSYKNQQGEWIPLEGNDSSVSFSVIDGNLCYLDDLGNWVEVDQGSDVVFSIRNGKLCYYSNGSWVEVGGDSTVTVEGTSQIVDLYLQSVQSGYSGSIFDFIDELEQATHDFQIHDDVFVSVQQNLGCVVSVWCENNNASSAGSGVIIDLDKENGNAYVITNCHVVYDDYTGRFFSDIYVALYGQEYSETLIETELVGGLQTYDIAVLKVENSDVIKNSHVTQAVVCQDQTAYVGETVYAIGNPDGAGIAVTMGIVSVDSETITMPGIKNSRIEIDYREIRVDAPINSGNSGGPLFNSKGQVIGIVNAKNTENENMGYVLPINPSYLAALKLIETYQNNGSNSSVGVVRKVLMGVTIQIASSTAVFEDGKTFIKETIQVVSTEAGSVSRGVLLQGDTLVSIIIDGVEYEITRLHTVTENILRCSVGDTIQMKLVRDGETLTVSITFGESNTATID